MIGRREIAEILSGYEKDSITVGTLGSHSALNIFKGAKDEGLSTLCICRRRDEIVYKKFPLADHIVLVDSFSELADPSVLKRLRELNVILVPHGSLNAYMSMEDVLNRLDLPMFGNRMLLSWEVDRERQRRWLLDAGLLLPKEFSQPGEIDRLVIAKFPGARGGKGYFLADSPQSFEKKARKMTKKGLLTKQDVERIYLQEYILGVNAYFHYFRSILRDDVELLGMDKRYESAVDSLGRIPAQEQLELDLNPTYTVVGNIPITLRESLLPTWHNRPILPRNRNHRRPQGLHVRDLGPDRRRHQRRHRYLSLRVPQVRGRHVHGEKNSHGDKGGHRAGCPRRDMLLIRGALRKGTTRPDGVGRDGRIEEGCTEDRLRV